MAEGMGEEGGRIKVTDPVKHGEGVNAYMSYRVVSTGGSGDLERSSIRRFSDFEWLHNRLCSAHRGVIVPPLPDKNVVEKFRFSKDFIEGRQRALDKFINRTAQHPVLKAAPELRHFLEDDEDTWSRQTLQAADVRGGGLLGKKSNDYMNIFKEMQWSLSSVMLGRPAPSSPIPAAPTSLVPGSENGVGSAQLGDDANEKLKLYTDELERILTDAHKQAAAFLKKQKETASSLSSLGAALLALGQAEGSGAAGGSSALSGQGYALRGDLGAPAAEGLGGNAAEQQGGQEELALLVGRAFVDVGKRCESVSTLILQQSGAYSEQVEETLKEYVRMVLSFKRVLSDQAAALREERHSEADLAAKRSRLDKLQATPGPGSLDRLRELETQVTEAQSKATQATTERQELAAAMHADVQRFHSIMLADMGGMLGDLKRLHMQQAHQSFECWSEGLPLLRSARTVLHQHRVQRDLWSGPADGGQGTVQGRPGTGAAEAQGAGMGSREAPSLQAGGE